MLPTTPECTGAADTHGGRRSALRAVGLAVVAALLLAVAALGYLRQRALPGAVAGEDLAWDACLQGYRRARTAADTLMVDGQRPVVSGGQATAARTCRELRRAGAPP